MTEHPDRDLSALYRAGAGESPPDALDARILKAASAAPPRESPVRRLLSALLRWQIGVGAAAVITLTVSLVALVEREHGQSPAPRPAESRGAVTEDRGGRDVPSDRGPETERPPTSPAVTAGAAGDALDREPFGSRQPTDSPDRQRTMAERAAPGPAVETGPAPAPVPSAQALLPPAAGVPREESPQVPPSAPARMRKEAAPQVVPSEPSARDRLSPGTGDARSSAPRSVAVVDPAEGVRWLLELQRQGRDRELREELDRFRRLHPDHPLPESLRRIVEAQPTGTPARPADPAAAVPNPAGLTRDAR